MVSVDRITTLEVKRHCYVASDRFSSQGFFLRWKTSHRGLVLTAVEKGLLLESNPGPLSHDTNASFIRVQLTDVLVQLVFALKMLVSFQANVVKICSNQAKLDYFYWCHL